MFNIRRILSSQLCENSCWLFLCLQNRIYVGQQFCDVYRQISRNKVVSLRVKCYVIWKVSQKNCLLLYIEGIFSQLISTLFFKHVVTEDHCIQLRLPTLCTREISNNFDVFVDIDECSIGEHNCDKGCLNVPGSYHCSCPLGFKLNKDGHTCSGIHIVMCSFKTAELHCYLDIYSIFVMLNKADTVLSKI